MTAPDTARDRYNALREAALILYGFITCLPTVYRERAPTDELVNALWPVDGEKDEN